MKRTRHISGYSGPGRSKGHRRGLFIEQMEPRLMMFATNGSWGTTNLSYSFNNFLDNATGWATGLSRVDMQNAIEESMGAWTAVTPLRFFQRTDSGPAPSDNLYDAGSHPTFRWGHHFIDGAMGLNTLAHAYGPGTNGRNGDAHFDDGNTWTINGILQTGVHEFGHAIGMAHANGDVSGTPPTCPAFVPAIMDACAGSFSYNGLESAFLFQDDIDGIRSLYGTGLGYVLDVFGELNVYGTGGNDLISVNVSGSNITVTSATIGGALNGSFTRALNDGSTTVNTIQLHGLGGNDILRAENTGGLRVNYYGGAGDDFFDLGFVSKNVSNIGEAQFFGGAGNDRVFVYDNLNSGGQTYAVTAARIDRPGWAGLRYNDSIEGLTLTTGSTANTVNVLSTFPAQPIVLNNGGGADVVNIGNSSNGVQSIQSDVTIYNDPNFTTLNINDGPNSNPRTATFDLSGGFGFVSGLAPATIYWDTNDIAAINVTNGRGVDTNNFVRNSETLNVNTTGGNDIVNIGSPSASGLQGITGGITIDNAPALSVLTINDAGSSILRTVTIDEAGGYNTIRGLAPALIRFDSTDVSEATIFTGHSADVVNILRNDEVLSLNSNGGNDIVTIGSPATSALQSITGRITIDNFPAYSVLTIDDTGSSIPRTVTIDEAGGYNTISGLAPALIRFDSSDVSEATIRTGATVDIVNILRNDEVLNLNSGGGNDIVTIGSPAAAGLQGIIGQVTIDNTPAFSVLSIDDTGSSILRTVTIDEAGGYNTISGLAPALIRFDSSDVSAVTIRTGSAADVVNISRNDEIFNLTSSGGNDVVTIGSPAAAGLQGITAQVTIENHAAYSVLTIDDTGSSIPRTVTIDEAGGFNTINGLAPALIRFDSLDISAATIRTGGAADIVNIHRNDEVLTVTSSGGNDVVVIGNDTNGCDGILASIALQNPPAFSRLTVNDSGNRTGRIWTVFSSDGFGRIGVNQTAQISYKLSNTSSPVTMNLGSGNDEVRVNGLEVRSLEINGNNGSDIVTVAGLAGSNAVITAPITFRGGIGDDQFIVHGDSMANMDPWATFDGGQGVDSFTINDQTATHGWAYYVFGAGMPAMRRFDDGYGFSSKVSLPAVETYTVNAGADSDGLVPEGVDPGVTVRFLGGDGTDDVFFQTSLSAVRGSVYFDGQSGSDSITTANNTNVAGQTAHLTQGSLGAVAGDNYWGPGGALHFTSVSDISLAFGSGPDQLIVDGAVAVNQFAFGANTLTFNGVFCEFYGLNGMTINGQSQVDTFLVQSPPAFPVTIRGNGGVDRLQGPDINNSWQITAADAGTLNGTVTFSTVEALTGGAAADTFAIAAGMKMSGKVNGGAGNDTINLSAYTSAVAVDLQVKTATGTGGFESIESWVGGSLNDRLTAANQANLWVMNGANAGTINGATFAGFEILNGGNLADSFRIVAGASLTGAIDGKGGADTIVGSDVANTWSISDSNAGRIQNVAFAAIENLTGGALTDTFVLARSKGVTGRIDGGGGRNTMDYVSYTTSVTVDLTAGTATNIGSGIANIRDVIGGSGADTLRGDGHDNFLNGGAGNDSLIGEAGNDVVLGGVGNDTLLGGTGRDLLFGGIGMDSIGGGAGEDIHFSGTTSFDNNRAALDAALAFWLRTDLSYAVRVSQLRSGITGVPQFNSANIFNDTSVDTLTGGDNLDWYFAALSGSPRDVLTDLAMGELTN